MSKTFERVMIEGYRKIMDEMVLKESNLEKVLFVPDSSAFYCNSRLNFLSLGHRNNKEEP